MNGSTNAGTYSPANVHEHVVELIRRHTGNDRAGGVHLDLGCGVGHVAEPLERELLLDYVGIDTNLRQLADVTRRGYETHAIDLAQSDLLAALEKILNGRRLVSISCINTLAQLEDTTHLLQALAHLLSAHRAIGVVAIPNITHVDIATRSLLGEWSPTVCGSPDAVSGRFFDADRLETELRIAGLGRIDAYEVESERSGHPTAQDHVGLLEHTSVAAWLRGLRRMADPHGLTEHFVWAVAPVPPQQDSAEVSSRTPFLSIVMRSQGNRPQELREALLCLAAQTETDFEVLLIGHRATLDGQLTIEAVVEDQPPRMRARIRTFWLQQGGRSAPLNLGLSEARGRYIALFDDDDLVFGNWVASFAEAAQRRPGRVVRATVLRQDVDAVLVRGFRGVMATGAPQGRFSKTFRLTEHLATNQSPAHGYAFPRSVVSHFGLRYDESITTTEDWQFLIRAVQICGVTDIEEATALYHWWPNRESSRTAHSHEEWLENRAAIERDLDALPLLLPAGETRWIREQLIRLSHLEVQLKQQNIKIRVMRRRLGKKQARITQLKRTLAKQQAQSSARPLPRRIARRVRKFLASAAGR